MRQQHIIITLILITLVITGCTLDLGQAQVSVGDNGGAETAADGSAGDGSGGPSIAQAPLPTVTPIPTAPAAARTTYTVQRGTVQDIFTFRGRWLPRDQTQLSFEVSGSVRAVNVRRDDTVNQGDLLADLQIDELENQLAQQQLNLERAQRNLETGGDTSEDSALNAQFNLANSRLQLQSQQVSLPYNQVLDAQANVETAKREIARAEQAYNDLVSRPDSVATSVDNALERVVSAREALEARERAYENALASYFSQALSVQQQENRVIQNEIALEDALQGGGNPDLVQAVNEAQLAIDQTQQRIQQSSLFAPIDGVVLEVLITPGDAVQAFNTVMTLAIPEPLEVIANLAFNEIQQLQVGQIGVCAVVNQPDTAVQCIVRQLPLSNRDVDQTVRVAAGLAGVQSGQLIEVEMVLEESLDTLWLPPAAVNTFQNRNFVILQTPEGERVQDVEIGLQTDDRVEILSGLNEGDIVVQQ